MNFTIVGANGKTGFTLTAKFAKLKLPQPMSRNTKKSVRQRALDIGADIRMTQKDASDEQKKENNTGRPILQHFAKESEKRQINIRISGRMRNALRGKQSKGGRAWASILGYTVDDLKLHLERQFKGKMNWSNLEKWDIDHIIPLSEFSFSSCNDDAFQKRMGTYEPSSVMAEKGLSGFRC